MYGSVGTGFLALVSYTFYRSLRLFFVLLPLGAVAYPIYKKRELLKRRQWKLVLQFKEAIGSLSSYLSAGYSVENAFPAAARELRNLYGGEAMIVREFSHIGAQLQMNKPVEQLLSEFARRSGSDDIRNFSEVFRMAKRSGGELCGIIEQTVTVLRDKISVSEEIRTMTASRRFEQKIMNLMPFGIILYIDLTSAGFFDVMYQTLAGRIVMTVCLFVYAAAYVMSERLLDIRV